MILQVPFVYEALIIKPRCRNPVKVAVKDVIAVEIKETTSAELPVAFKIGKTQLRWDGSKLWDFYKTSVCHKKPKKVKSATVRKNTENAGKNYKWSCAGAEAPFHNYWSNLVHLSIGQSRVGCLLHKWFKDEDVLSKEDTVFKTWVSDNRDAIAQVAIEKASNMLFCDGYLYKIVGEPYYFSQTYGGSKNNGGTELHCCVPSTVGAPDVNFFNALQLKEAIQYAEQVAINRGDTNNIPMSLKANPIKVLIKDAVKLRKNTFFDKETKQTFVLRPKDAELLEYVIGQNNCFDYLEAKDIDIARKYWEGMKSFGYVIIADYARVGLDRVKGKFVTVTDAGKNAVAIYRKKQSEESSVV